MYTITEIKNTESLYYKIIKEGVERIHRNLIIAQTQNSTAPVDDEFLPLEQIMSIVDAVVSQAGIPKYESSTETIIELTDDDVATMEAKLIELQSNLALWEASVKADISIKKAKISSLKEDIDTIEYRIAEVDKLKIK